MLTSKLLFHSVCPLTQQFVSKQKMSSFSMYSLNPLTSEFKKIPNRFGHTEHHLDKICNMNGSGKQNNKDYTD